MQACNALRLPLTDEPSPPVSLAPPLALLAITPTGSVAPLVSRFVVLPAYGSSRSPPAITSVPSSIFSPHREVWHRPVLPPMTNVLGGTAPPWCLIGGAVRHLWPALCSSPAPRSSAAPLPSRAYKRAAPSSSFPAPASAIPLLPRPSSIRGRAAAIVFLPGEPSLSSPCPSIGPSSDCLSLLASPHRHERSTPLPHPDYSPKAHRRQPRREAPPPPRGHPPPRPPLPQSSLPLGSPTLARAKAPTRCQRTGSPAANRRRAHRRPGSLPADGRFAPPSTVAPFSPPPLSLTCGPAATASSPRAPAPSPALGRSWAGTLARALRLAGPDFSPPAHQN
jgi:hypothetical protein